VFASSASPRGTGPRWDVPQLARIELHHAQHVIALLDVLEAHIARNCSMTLSLPQQREGAMSLTVVSLQGD
jgi:hypothetical protein